jgi:dTDP-glucose 4,6-dehydratase
VILVTGAAGLVGSELVRRLAAEGRPVRGIDLLAAPTPPGTQSVVGDLLDADACRWACAGVTAIVHTAARQHHSGVPKWGRERFFAANAEMTRNLTEAAKVCGVGHFVLVSSDMVYGLPPGRPLTEADEPQPIGPYGRSKLASEEACIEARETGMQVTILRPRLIIGPGRLGILRKLFDRIRRGKAVPMLGSGRNRYQMVSVADVAVACSLALQQPRDDTFNLGSANPPPVRDLLKSLIQRAGSPSTLLPLPSGLAHIALWSLHAVRVAPLVPEQFCIADVDYVLDTMRAARVIGWRPQLSDADMLWSAYRTYVAKHAAAPASSDEKSSVHKAA